MERLSERGRSERRPQLAPLSYGVARPELLFRRMAPSEQLLSLAREQDQLYRAVIDVDGEASHVTIERQVRDAGTRYWVTVRSHAQGREACGCADHADAEIALRAAYTSLLRHAAGESACPCREAA